MIMAQFIINPSSFALFLILLGVIVFATVILYFLLRNTYKRWRKIDFPGKIERFDVQIPIPRRNSFLRGEIYRLKGRDYKRDPAPVVILSHGFKSNHQNLDWVSVPLALEGYAVVAYDHFAHGWNKSIEAKAGNPEVIYDIALDFNDVVAYIEGRDDLDNYRIAVVSFSMGSLIALTQGYVNPRVRVIIANCCPYEVTAVKKMTFLNKILFRLIFRLTTNFSEEMKEKISPKYYIVQHRYAGKKVYLTHCMDDPVIRVENFENNKKLLNLDDEQVLLFDKGGHNYRQQETLLVSQIIKWLGQNF